MTERPEAEMEPAEGSRETVDRALEESPAKGVIDEHDPDPPEPSEPA
jgi:hypothetical protein